MTPAGQMNRRVQIMRKGGLDNAGQNDAFGQPIEAGTAGWQEVRRPWAKIDPQIAGKTAQVFSSGEFTSKVAVLITFRYSKKDRITTADQVVFTEPGSDTVHTYRINDVTNPKQQNEDIVLICEELNAGE